MILNIIYNAGLHFYMSRRVNIMDRIMGLFIKNLLLESVRNFELNVPCSPISNVLKLLDSLDVIE